MKRPEIRHLLLCETGARRFIIDAASTCSFLATEQSLDGTMHTDPGKAPFATLPFRFSHRSRLEHSGHSGSLEHSGGSPGLCTHGPGHSGGSLEHSGGSPRHSGLPGSLKHSGSPGQPGLCTHGPGHSGHSGGSGTRACSPPPECASSGLWPRGGVAATVGAIGRTGTRFDVWHIVIGLLMASPSLLSSVMDATPPALRRHYFGDDGATFRRRVGDHLLGSSQSPRLPGAVIVAAERLVLEDACRCAGLGCHPPT